MTIYHAAHFVERRFLEDKESIERYVDLLRTKLTIHDQQIRELNLILNRVDAKTLATRDYNRSGQPFSANEIQELLESVRQAGPDLFQTILGYEQRLDDIPSNLLNTPAADYMDQFSEWVEYFIDHLTDNPDENEIHSLIDHATAAYAREVDTEAGDCIPEDALQALLPIAVEHAVHAKVNERIDAMVYAREQFDEIQIMAQMTEADKAINPSRQAFILLMTAFDAAVFDLSRIALHQKFFDLIGTFGKQDKITLDAIGAAGNFETLRDIIIEQQLKKRYLKDLIGLLHGLGVELVDEANGGQFVHLVELVLRRNLIVHNRGIVDERYLEVDVTSGNPKFNIYGLKLEDAAVIDDAYFDIAVRLTSGCVAAMVRWIGK